LSLGLAQLSPSLFFYFFYYFYRKEVDDFFKTLDTDFDGRLTFGEFLGEESYIERLFKSMDKNRDGYVSKQVILISLIIYQCPLNTRSSMHSAQTSQINR
jgi:Ca2+-binding EF-hand superfamily protein